MIRLAVSLAGVSEGTHPGVLESPCMHGVTVLLTIAPASPLLPGEQRAESQLCIYQCPEQRRRQRRPCRPSQPTPVRGREGGKAVKTSHSQQVFPMTKTGNGALRPSLGVVHLPHSHLNKHIYEHRWKIKL